MRPGTWVISIPQFGDDVERIVVTLEPGEEAIVKIVIPPKLREATLLENIEIPVQRYNSIFEAVHASVVAMWAGIADYEPLFACLAVVNALMHAIDGNVQACRLGILQEYAVAGLNLRMNMGHTKNQWELLFLRRMPCGARTQGGSIIGRMVFHGCVAEWDKRLRNANL